MAEHESNGHDVILMAEDDHDYFVLTREALRGIGGRGVDIEWVEDGDDCLDYLLRRGRFAGRASAQPRMILLDLNMPRMNGHEMLAEMHEYPELRAIPVVVLTASRAQEDVERAYALGARSYIAKPFHYEDLLEVAATFSTYWFETVRLPGGEPAGH
jgi:two-component system response regulator